MIVRTIRTFISRSTSRNLCFSNLENRDNLFKLKHHYCTNKVVENDDNSKYPTKYFSGVQPTGVLHIGNYLGAIKRWVDLQNAGENVTCSIVDLHSITLPQNPDILRHNTLLMAATLLACGIDPSKSTLFLQSAVPQHTELCWILSCLTTMARLSHLPQYKEKSHKLKEIPLGLFIYPVLQAADILLYKSTHIPVGEDQVQHLQLAQHLAKIFNHKFGNTFPSCHAVVANDASCRVKSLRDPTKKMSKSDADIKSCILLTDTPDIIREKIKKSVTDFTSEVTFEPEKRLGVANLITIHSLVSNLLPEEICELNQLNDTGKYKLVVADAVIEHLNPIRKKIDEYMLNPEYIHMVLRDANYRAQEIAELTMQEVRMKIGLLKNSIEESSHCIKTKKEI